jgi:hypothetical protein
MILWIRHVERRFHNSRAVAAIRVDRLLLKAMREIIAEGAVSPLHTACRPNSKNQAAEPHHWKRVEDRAFHLY